jgi:ubiquitin-activating enzyme E1
LNYFQVGSGAIGCELLKNFALMGLSCGPKGKLFLTDMDTIEVSNLSRQFLFRTQHVGMHKSSVSSNAVKAVNPAMKLEALTKKVAHETENYFNDEFWVKLSGVANALDNFEARRYMDQQCLFYKKPMIDPATSGIQCELNITVPKITTSWSAGYQIPQEESFEICTIHNLPNKIVHTIHYARVAAFQKYFVEDPENLKKYIQMGPSCYDKLIGNLRNEFVLSLGRSLLKPPSSFEDCVEWAYRKWEEEFVYKAQRILDDYPLNSKLEDGSPYWVGSVRPPTPQVFDVNNPIHLEFVIAVSYLRAYTMGVIKDEHKPQDPEVWNQQREYIRKLVSTFKPIPYVSTTPSSGQVITKKKQQQQQQITYTQEEISKIISDLPPPHAVKLSPNVCDFEKDDDTNFHIDCIYTWSSNRAQMYAIKLETRLRTKIICGNIIPAIITTTAFVAGFACLELIKQHQPGKKLEDFNNIMANLAGPMVQIFPPNEKTQHSAGKIGFNEWTRVDIPPSVVTFGDLDKWMQSYNIVINTIGVQGGLLWLGMRTEESLKKKIVDAYAETFHQGNAIPDHIYHFVMQIDAKDKKGKSLVDAETQTSLLPIICFWIKKKSL